LIAYTGRHAQLYDVFYRDKPYEQEATFVDRALQRAAEGPTGRVLELACGTGSHALALARKGYRVEAVDNSEDMLSQARSKAVGAAVEVAFRVQDMRHLPTPQRPFDAVVCLFDSIGYVATNEGLREVFEGVHRSLRPGGLFLFEFWHAPAMLRNYEPVRVRTWDTAEGEILRIAETTLDCERQLARVHYRILEMRRDGTYSRFEETQVNRYFLVQEMTAWLVGASFAPLHWYAGFNTEEPITENTWHVVALARRPGTTGP
jgi:SAM-dependent methyltransferase